MEREYYLAMGDFEDEKKKIKSFVHSLTQNLKVEKDVKESKAFGIFFKSVWLYDKRDA